MAAEAMADQTLESRVARLESDVAHIRSDIAEMKLDIRDLRKNVRDLDAKISNLEYKLIGGLASNRVWMLLQSAAILGVMARGFKWL
jgi:outer membrane murein-binding lipoprotein Lpp